MQGLAVLRGALGNIIKINLKKKQPNDNFRQRGIAVTLSEQALWLVHA